MALFGIIGEFVEARENWSQYVERLEQFFIANDITDAKKKSIFLSFIGPAAFHTLGNLVSPQKPSEESYDRLVELMSSFYNPKPLVTVQRFRFYSRFRQPNESVSTFVAELRSLAKDCQFGDSLQENLRERLICGIADQTIQKRLLSEQNLSFKKAFDIAQSHESAERNIVILQGSTSHSLEIHKVTSPRVSDTSCYRCGQSDHHHDTCRFKSSTCHYCGKLGHIQTVCRSRRSFSTRDTSNRPFVDSSSRPSYRSSDSDSSRHTRHPIRSSHPRSSHVKQVVGNNDEPDNTEEYSLFNLPSGSCAPLVVTILIDHTSLSMEVDTGASFSVVSKNTYKNSSHLVRYSAQPSN